MKQSYSCHSFIVFISLLMFLTFVLQSVSVIADDGDTLKKYSPENHHEVIDSEYIPVSVDDMPRSPAYRTRNSNYFTTQVNISDEGENIVGDAANEPSIAIDPTNPDRMVMGWRQFNTVNNNFRQAGYAFSLDGGETWTFPGVIDPEVFRSDPVLDSDAEGNIYYNSLTVVNNEYLCDVYKMPAGTTEWDEGTFAQGGDKQWMTIDKTAGQGRGHIYASWTSYFSYCYPDFFTRSVDGGLSYEECTYVSGLPYWGTLTTGPDGTLYAAGYSDFGFIVSRSSSAQNPDWPVFWESFETVDLDAVVTSRDGPNPGGLIGQTWVATDHSGGAHHGNVYLLCSAARLSFNDPADVMFARSTDGGVTWDEPIRVNQDIGNNEWQWFGTMSVAPDGRIDVVWLDTRDHDVDQYSSSLYYAYSIDGGETFSANERISDSFDPHVGWPQQDKMGDYFHMISDMDYAHLAWANTLNGEQDTYYTRISPWFVGADENQFKRELMVSAHPNPSTDYFTIRYVAEKNGDAEIILLDIFGKQIRRYAESGIEPGSNILKINATELPAGVYYVLVTMEDKAGAVKIVVGK